MIVRAMSQILSPAIARVRAVVGKEPPQLWKLVKQEKMANTKVALSGAIPVAGPPTAARSSLFRWTQLIQATLSRRGSMRGTTTICRCSHSSSDASHINAAMIIPDAGGSCGPSTGRPFIHRLLACARWPRSCCYRSLAVLFPL
jgi:hypothetical protein